MKKADEDSNVYVTKTFKSSTALIKATQIKRDKSDLQSLTP